jgi:predicted ATPase
MLTRLRTNLAVPPTELLGREDELAVLVDLLAAERLVTVSGPGGAGKTRLALEVAQQVADGFDGAWFVALEQVAEPAEVIDAIARVLGLPELGEAPTLARVLAHARERRLLLVLDNLERVIEAAPLIRQVARAGPDVRVLVTSPAPLRVGGEHVLRLEPLGLPTGAERDLTSLGAVPAVALLVQRAAAGSGFALTEDNRTDVARLCRQLAGMPLALELAAARLGVLDASELSRHLERGIGALGAGGRDLPPRQRGLRAVLEWSTGLLSDAEGRLLGRVAVFAVGFTAELAAAAFGDVTGELATLIDAGLVRSATDGRLAVLPPVRRFAAELMSDEEDDAAHAAIVDVFVRIAEPIAKRWVVAADDGWPVLNPEAGNILAELDWARDMDEDRHARLAAAVGWWLSQTGHSQLGRAHVELALSRIDEPGLRARCLQALGVLGLSDVDPAASSAAADAWRELGDVEGEFYSVLYAANLYGHARQVDAEKALVDRAAAIFQAAPDPDKEWILATVQAEVDWRLGQPEPDAPLRALLDRSQPQTWREFWLATRIADIALDAGRYDEALRFYGVAMTALHGYGSISSELVQADTIVSTLWRMGRAQDAATALGVSDLAHSELSWEAFGEMAEHLDEVRAGLDPDRLAAGRERAEQLGMEAGVAWVRTIARGEPWL